MTARTHDLAAATAFGVFVILHMPTSMRLSTFLVALLANQIGGIAPDIDQPTAPFWRNLPVGGFIGRIFDKMLGGHRFLTHSLLGVALFSYLAYLLLGVLHPLMPHIDTHFVLIAFMIGMLSHLVMDTITKEGVPWLLPIPIKFGLPPIKKLRITTGSFFETLVFLGILAFDVWFASANYTQILALLHRHLT
ncbi:MAG TPA: metal-dependent hydrolase [Patescibacteria group bacterium]|nr:metal-dependent hydrolase [Patescibacteria group bacterium]